MERVLSSLFLILMGAGVLVVARRGYVSGELPAGVAYYRPYRPNREDNPLAFHLFLALYFCGGMALLVWGIIGTPGLGAASYGREPLLPEAPGTDPDVQFSRIRFLGCTRFRVEQNIHAYTTCYRLTSVSCGRAIANRSSALSNASQVKLFRFPPRRLSHLDDAVRQGEDLFRELGNMHPSKSSLDRLPKQLSERWEAARQGFESTLREQDPTLTAAADMIVI